jgi:hypothetical protein
MLRDLSKYISCLPKVSVLPNPGNVDERLIRSTALSSFDIRLAINGERKGGSDYGRYGRIAGLDVGVGKGQAKK